jgi:hypothetical protein
MGTLIDAERVRQRWTEFECSGRREVIEGPGWAAGALGRPAPSGLARRFARAAVAEDACAQSGNACRGGWAHVPAGLKVRISASRLLEFVQILDVPITFFSDDPVRAPPVVVNFRPEADHLGFSTELKMRFTKALDILNVRAMVAGLIPALNDARMRFALPSGIWSLSPSFLSWNSVDLT